MMVAAEDIKWFHVEASSKCNAWCPACPRNNQGFGLVEGLVEQDLDPVLFEKVLLTLPSIECVQFCGTYGDPIASNNINDLISIAKKYVRKIQIHTNGSLRNTTWWEDLGNQLADIEHDIWFGIDGLEGVHEIYRQGTDFKKIMQNAQSFIATGGHATWQFIPYKHNEHKTIYCFKLSQKLGFKKFKLVKFYRNQTVARHYKTGIEFDLLPTDSLRQVINFNPSGTSVEPNNCMHLSIPSIYMAANGTLSRCCYMSDREKFTDIPTLLDKVTDLSDQQCIKHCR